MDRDKVACECGERCMSWTVWLSLSYWRAFVNGCIREQFRLGYILDRLEGYWLGQSLGFPPWDVHIEPGIGDRCDFNFLLYVFSYV